MYSGDELIPRLSELNAAIDDTYSGMSSDVGFTCGGCDGVKCCTVDLSLHTYIEMLYLRRGFKTLDQSVQEEVLERSRAIVEAKNTDPCGAYRDCVCALNADGLCVLYQYRPMICRLAGIPHYIQRPDGRLLKSGGCERYKTDIQEKFPHLALDRTGFYRQLAEIEIEIVRARGARTKTKTVAETLAMTDFAFEID
jgi:hypothetical protein